MSIRAHWHQFTFGVEWDFYMKLSRYIRFHFAFWSLEIDFLALGWTK